MFSYLSVCHNYHTYVLIVVSITQLNTVLLKANVMSVENEVANFNTKSDNLNMSQRRFFHL